MSNERGYLYFLESEKDGSVYYGSTNNIQNRCERHNQGRVTSTKNRIPWKLLTVISFEKVEEARRIEQKIKGRKEKISSQKI